MDSQENTLNQGTIEEPQVEATVAETPAVENTSKAETKTYATKQEVLDRVKEIAHSDEAPQKNELDLLKTTFYKLHLAERDAQMKEYVSCTVLGVLLVKIIETNAALRKVFVSE